MHTDVGGPQKTHPWKGMQVMFTSSLHHIIHNKMESWRGKIEWFWRWQDAFYMKKIYLKNWNYKYSSIFSKQIANKSVKEVDPFQSLVWVSTWKTWSLHLLSQGGVSNFEFCLSILSNLNFEVKYCRWSLAQNLQHPNIFLFLFGQDLVSIL